VPKIALPGKQLQSELPAATQRVRNAKTGLSVTVKGVGALKGEGLKIKKGLSLLKPIAKQALRPHAEKRAAPIQRPERRKAG
jgi:hypothetical protein